MANARLARFITEVAPPQFVSVMRHRTSKVLDTINEEDSRDSREYVGSNDSLKSSPKGSSPSSSSPRSSSSPSSPRRSLYSFASAASAAALADSKHFLKGVHRSFSVPGCR